MRGREGFRLSAWALRSISSFEASYHSLCFPQATGALLAWMAPVGWMGNQSLWSPVECELWRSLRGRASSPCPFVCPQSPEVLWVLMSSGASWVICVS